MGLGERPVRRQVADLLRERIMRRDRFRCLACGSQEDLTLDHITAISRGGTNDEGNLRTLCRSCNSIKKDRDISLSQIRCRKLELCHETAFRLWLRGGARKMSIEDLRFYLGEHPPISTGEACLLILRESTGPLGASEVAKRALERRLISPAIRHPKEAISWELARHARDGSVIRTERGLYALETLHDGEDKFLTWAEVARVILIAAGEPLNAPEIARRAMRAGLKGADAKRPSDSIKYELSRAAQEGGAFVRVSRGLYALR